MLRDILGSIVTLLSPLSVHSLSRLLNIELEDIDDCLEDLHAILDIPRDPTRVLRLHHPSFRDFLLNKDRCTDLNFWVVERSANEALAARCIQLMSGSLKEDICGVTKPGTYLRDVKSRQIDESLPPEIQYACLHWVEHLRRSGAQLRDNDYVDQFLRNHFLHWLEVLSWMQKISEGILELISLESITSVASCPTLSAFVWDMKRFALHNRAVIEQTPLQVYCSALLFTPVISLVRKEFMHKIPRWVKRWPAAESDWSATLQTLDGHSSWINAIAFSPNSKQLASGSDDSTVRIWNSATGMMLQTLRGHLDRVCTVVFSPDGKQLASGSDDGTARVWDVATGVALQTLKGHSDRIRVVVFSPNSKQLASGSDDMTVRIWDVVTGLTLQTIRGHSNTVVAVCFSPDSKKLTSNSDDLTVRVWDVATGANLQINENCLEQISVPAFSPDGKCLASNQDPNTVILWDVTTRVTLHTFEGHSKTVDAIVFSPDGRQLATGSEDKTVRVWDATTGATLQVLQGHSDRVNAVAFSPDGKQLASGGWDKTVRVWDLTAKAKMRPPEGHSNRVQIVVFSPDGKQAASGSWDNTVRIWDAANAVTLQILERYLIILLAFSPDGKQLASSAEANLQVWNTATGTELEFLAGHSEYVDAIAYSPDSKLLASASVDRTVRVWEAATGAMLQTLKGHSDAVSAVTYSPNGKQLASGSRDKTVRVWDANTGLTLHILEGHSNPIFAVVFSPDSKQLASCSGTSVVRLWDAATGAETQIFQTSTDFYEMLSCCSYGLYTGRRTATTLCKNALLSTIPPPESSQLVAFQPRIFVQDEWILCEGDRMLRLPSDYRPYCSAIHENVVSLGHISGRVSIFEFEFSI